MSNRYLTEAFKALNLLDEEVFELNSDESISKLKDFIDGDTLDDTQQIIDVDAETQDELEDSYVGKVIIECDICKSMLYKNPDEVILNDDETLANEDEECPYCHTMDGFKVIGQVAPFNKDTQSEIEKSLEDEKSNNEEDITVSDITIDDIPGDEIKENLSKSVNTRTYVMEGFNNVEIETEDEKLSMSQDETGKVTVTTEPINNIENEIISDETIVPLESDIKAEITDDSAEEIEPIEDINTDDFIDADIEEFDEDEFDELGESYLKKVYDNVDSYKTIRGKVNNNTLTLEGLIRFKSGKTAKTSFKFEAHTVTKTGKYKLLGENTQFSNNKKAFIITGKLNDKKFVTESFTYNYSGKDAKSGKNLKLYGTIKKHK